MKPHFQISLMANVPEIKRETLIPELLAARQKYPSEKALFPDNMKEDAVRTLGECDLHFAMPTPNEKEATQLAKAFQDILKYHPDTPYLITQFSQPPRVQCDIMGIHDSGQIHALNLAIDKLGPHERVLTYKKDSAQISKISFTFTNPKTLNTLTRKIHATLKRIGREDAPFSLKILPPKAGHTPYISYEILHSHQIELENRLTGIAQGKKTRKMRV